MKRLYFALLALGLSVCFVGCNNPSDSIAKIEKLEQENATLKDENSKLQEEINKYKEQEAEVAAKEKKEQKEKNQYKQINIGDTVTVENYGEFVIESCNLTQKITPSNPASFYTYYEVKDPQEIYLDVVMNFKNTSTIGIGADKITDVKVIYSNGYEYGSFSTIEESGGSNFTYTNITTIEPLKSSKLHYIATLPIEAKDSQESIKIQFTVYDNKYELQVR